MVYTGQVVLAAKASRSRLVDCLVMPTELPAAARARAKELCACPTGKSPFEPRASDVSEIEALFAEKSVDELHAIATTDSWIGSRESRAALRLLKSRSLMVLRSAESLFNDGIVSECATRAADSARALASILFERDEAHEALARAARQQKSRHD